MASFLVQMVKFEFKHVIWNNQETTPCYRLAQYCSPRVAYNTAIHLTLQLSLSEHYRPR
jgi:hypothetical protein